MFLFSENYESKGDYINFEERLANLVDNPYSCPKCGNSDIFELMSRYFLCNNEGNPIITHTVFIKCNKCQFTVEYKKAISDSPIAEKVFSGLKSKINDLDNVICRLSEVSTKMTPLLFSHSETIARFYFEDDSYIDVKNDGEGSKKCWIRINNEKEWITIKE